MYITDKGLIQSIQTTLKLKKKKDYHTVKNYLDNRNINGQQIYENELNFIVIIEMQIKTKITF